MIFQGRMWPAAGRQLVLLSLLLLGCSARHLALDTDETKNCDKVDIKTSKRCYRSGEDIYIEFGNERCQHVADKIAIYHIDEHDLESSRPAIWMYACGSVDCLDKVDIAETASDGEGKNTNSYAPISSEVPIDDPKPSAEWPLPPGIYRAVLIRENPVSRSASYSRSDPFHVVDVESNSEECLLNEMNGRVSPSSLRSQRRVRHRFN